VPGEPVGQAASADALALGFPEAKVDDVGLARQSTGAELLDDGSDVVQAVGRYGRLERAGEGRFDGIGLANPLAKRLGRSGFSALVVTIAGTFATRKCAIPRQ
jgi:hypothetical protein